MSQTQIPTKSPDLHLSSPNSRAHPLEAKDPSSLNRSPKEKEKILNSLIILHEIHTQMQKLNQQMEESNSQLAVLAKNTYIQSGAKKESLQRASASHDRSAAFAAVGLLIAASILRLPQMEAKSKIVTPDSIDNLGRIGPDIYSKWMGAHSQADIGKADQQNRLNEQDMQKADRKRDSASDLQRTVRESQTEGMRALGAAFKIDAPR